MPDLHSLFKKTTRSRSRIIRKRRAKGLRTRRVRHRLAWREEYGERFRGSCGPKFAKRLEDFKSTWRPARRSFLIFTKQILGRKGQAAILNSTLVASSWRSVVL